MTCRVTEQKSSAGRRRDLGHGHLRKASWDCTSPVEEAQSSFRISALLDYLFEGQALLTGPTNAWQRHTWIAWLAWAGLGRNSSSAQIWISISESTKSSPLSVDKRRYACRIFQQTKRCLLVRGPCSLPAKPSRKSALLSLSRLLLRNIDTNSEASLGIRAQPPHVETTMQIHQIHTNPLSFL